MDLTRQSFLGKESDATLAGLRVAIVGLGGGGSHMAQQLSHVGVGQFVLVDFDRIEDSNLNRLVGATAKDAAKRLVKVEIVGRRIKAINPRAKVKLFAKHWQDTGVVENLADCDAIFGCVDSYANRRDLEAAARRYLIPYIDIGMDVHPLSDGEFCISGQAILSLPGQLCLRCMGFLTEEVLATEAQNYGAAGGRPQVVWSNGVLASLAVGIFMQLFTPWHKSHSQPIYLEYDGNTEEVKQSSRLPILEGRTCSHFKEINSIGDPSFGLA